MATSLKCWNGRGYALRKRGCPLWAAACKDKHGNLSNHSPSVFLCAKSRADAVRMIQDYLGCDVTGLDYEIKNYFSDCWGSTMEGVTPERGIWVEFTPGQPPVRVFGQ